MAAEEKPYLTGRTYIFRMKKGEDLLAAIVDFCPDNQIKCGVINAIGAVQNATMGYYNQKKKKYDKHVLDEELEIASLMGNVSIMDNRPMVHAHITLSDDEGGIIGGHLMSGTKIFACEIFIQELVGNPKVRKKDKATKLPLWM